MDRNRAQATIILLLAGLTCAVAGREYVVDRNHPGCIEPGAEAAEAGTAQHPFAVIQQAASVAGPGDTVTVRAGTYRERVAPHRGGKPGAPVMYRAAPNAEVVIKGSEIWTPRPRPVEGHPGVVRAELDSSLFPKYNPYRLKLVEGAGTLGQVFVDGRPLIAVDSQEDLFALQGTWMVIDSAEAILLHYPDGVHNLENHMVELTTRKRIFAPYKRGLGHVTVRGFVMEHCGNQLPVGFWDSPWPQAGAIGSRAGHHWIIEQNTIRYAKTVAVDIGDEGDEDSDGLGQPKPRRTGQHIVRYNLIEYNGAAGIVGLASYGTKIVGNTIRNNARLGINGNETSGIKLHRFMGGLIAENLIQDNDASGIWLDNVWRNSRITRNVIVGNAGAGLFIEMGTGPLLIDNNVVALTTALHGLAGDGIYSHDASRVTCAHNLIFFNANYGIWSHIGTNRGVLSRNYTAEDVIERRRKGKSRERVAQSEWRILNNIIVGNHAGALSLPARSERSRGTRCDYNLICGGHNRMTSETWARELDSPYFTLNSSKGRVPVDTLIRRLRHRLDSAGVQADLKHYGRLPLLTLAQWRAGAGFDVNSRVPRILRPNMAKHHLWLRFHIDETPRSVNCPSIEGIDHDFLGAALPDSGRVPGPFQSLAYDTRLNDRSSITEFRGPYNDLSSGDTTLNHIRLWPLRTPREAAHGEKREPFAKKPHEE